MAKMIKKRLPLLGLALALGLAAPALRAAPVADSTATFTVQDSSGNAIAGAEVFALFFNNGFPDPSISTAALTDAAGHAVFAPAQGTGLIGNYYYQFAVSAQGYVPGIVAQFQNGAQSVGLSPTSQAFSTFTLTPAAYAGVSVGEIDLPFTNATADGWVMGQISLEAGGGGAVQYGMVKADASGAGTLSFTNVTAAPGGTYQASAFDPAANNGSGQGIPPQTVGSALTSGGVLTMGSVDLNALGQPPVADVSSAQQNAGGQNGSLSVSGVFIDTTPSHHPIPNVNVNFAANYQDSYGQSHNDYRGATADQNGVFQVYGLIPGVTYYMSVFDGCSQGFCYQGFQANPQSGAYVPDSDNIVSVDGTTRYSASSTTAVSLTGASAIQLSGVLPSTGTVAVYVQDQFGDPMPQVGVGIFPDFGTWQVSGGASCGGQTASSPGTYSSNSQAATGYYLISGLPSGNYEVAAWTPYGQTNFSGSQSSCGSGNYRLTIDTMAVPDVELYDDHGNFYEAQSSITITVQISTAVTGVVHGQLSFLSGTPPSPSTVDLRSDPIMISLFSQCSSNCPTNGGNLKVFNAGPSTGPVIDYSLSVSSGYAYYFNVNAGYWGPVFAGGNQPTPDLTSSTAAVVNIQFEPAGRVLGTLRKPDGSAFIPPQGSNSSNVQVAAEGENAWGQSQVNPDGTFIIGGLLPGVYTLQERDDSHAFPFTTKAPAAQVTVAADQDVHHDIQLADAVNILPSVNAARLPSFTPTTCTGSGGQGDCPADDIVAWAQPAGQPLNATAVANLLTGGGDSQPGVYDYVPLTGNINRYGCSGTYLAQPGFCAGALAANGQLGTSYDFYVLRKGGFDSGNLSNGARPFFVIEASSRSIPVNGSLATTALWSNQGGGGGSTTTVQAIDLGPAADLSAAPQAVLVGSVTAVNMIDSREFQALGGDFNKFTAYLPQVWVYDSTGTLKGVGMATPYPPIFGLYPALQTNLQGAVAAGDYSTFKTMMNSQPPSGWGAIGYEIRGLTAGATYTIVATSPNYPPYKTSVVLGGSGSTTRLDVDLDSNAGSTLSGVVKSTAGVVIPGASVTVSAPGYTAVTLTTDDSGSWTLEGLAAGQYKVDVVAGGYAETAEFVGVSANASVTAPTVTLSLAGASISGFVSTTDPDLAKGAVFGIKLDTSAAYPLANVTVAAYDDTLNVQDTGAPLALIKTVTDSSGAYQLKGLRVGDTYRLFVDQPEYYVSNQTAQTVSGDKPDVNFHLLRKPLDVNVFGYPSGANFEFQITNFKSFSGGGAWIGGSTFDKATSTDVSSGFQQRPDASGEQELFLDYPQANLTAGQVYTLHIEAQPADPSKPTVVKELTFGLGLTHHSGQSIDETLIGDETLGASGIPSNEVPVDPTGGDPSAVSLPPGGVIPTFSTAVPSVSMSATDASDVAQASGLSTAAVAGSVYDVTLSSVNYAGGVDLTLKYDQKGADLNDLAIYAYDQGSAQWKSVPGVQTLDPVAGTISVRRLKSLTSVLQVGAAGARVSGAGGATAVSTPYMALSDGKSYRVNPASLVLRPDDSGLFVILRPSAAGSSSFSGTTVKIYNFPNPFDLTTKTVSLNTTASNACATAGLPATVNTDGTVIKYEVPAGLSGQGAIRIYTLSGRLVRELDGGNVQGGNCYYTTWDGRNRTGQQVADGVYYGILTVSGNKAGGSNGIFKMAVIK